MAKFPRARSLIGHAFVTLAAVARTSGGESILSASNDGFRARIPGFVSNRPFFLAQDLTVPSLWLGPHAHGRNHHTFGQPQRKLPLAFAWHPLRKTCEARCLASSFDNANEKLAITAAEALKGATRDLNASGVPEATASAEVLLSAVMDASRSTIRLKGRSMTMSKEQFATYNRYISDRIKRVPVQYIIGEWEFYNLDRVIVRPPTLIPRPETEELVDMIIKSYSEPPDTFLEVGPGSGVISLSLLRAWPNSRATAVDLCEHAVKLTRDNAELLNMSDRIIVVHSGIAEFAASCHKGQMFDMIVSNPPYIPSAEIDGLEDEVIKYEDRAALDGGPDGLNIIHDILFAASVLVRDGGRVWMEVDRSHPIRLEMDRSPVKGVHFDQGFTDLSGNPRFVAYSVRH